MLNVQGIAEGVEDKAQLALLSSHGCDKIQDFFLSRPLERPVAEALVGLATRPPRQPG